MDKHPWDHHSDQPYPIRDRAYKKRMKRRHRKDLIKLFIASLMVFPIALLHFLFNRKTGMQQVDQSFFGLCVNLDKGEEQFRLLDELGCQTVQIRVFLSDYTRRKDEYLAFVKRCQGRHILITLVQDADCINDHRLLRAVLEDVFSAFSGLCSEYQVGNTINRTKWGFFSVRQYLDFYQVAQQLKDEKYPQLTLVGPSVIDFEYHYLIRAMFSRANVRFDKVSSLLYVDRRGAPENTQLGIFDTVNKIHLLHSICRLSPKSSERILLTEVNWPLSGTAPWAPTSETECVGEEDYARFLLRYHLLALASGKVETVYWHQLIAPGYGLIDNREGIRYRTAFKVYQAMLQRLSGAEQLRYTEADGWHSLEFIQQGCKGRVVWSECGQQPVASLIRPGETAFDLFGEPAGADLQVGPDPAYLVRSV
ncbi:hypothetical protein [Aliamphritea hakodatensis]|uniref:hypothetical protein n=1 Tax=Aliamphritea hakodatensis TaxID=2895352 RepID=UPI0022FD478A|nr:hypothetical protein [Aliamphritea hakodatensis]